MEAIRALERRLSDVVYRQMISDAKHVTVAGDGSGRTLGSDSAIQRGQPIPTADSSDKSLPGPVNRKRRKPIAAAA